MTGQKTATDGNRGGTANRVEGFRLSFQQQRIWQTHASSASPGWAQALVHIDGAVDPDRLAAALRTVADRHGALRARYRRVPGASTALADIAPEGTGNVEWTVKDLRALTEADIPGHVDAAGRYERLCPAGIDDAAPLRARLLRFSGQRHALLITTSGLSADSLALRGLTAELTLAYDGRSPGGAEPLQYIQYAQWQLQQGADESVTGDGADPVAAGNAGAAWGLPLRRPLPPAAGAPTDPAVVRLDRTVPSSLAGAVRACAQQHGVTTEVVLLTCLMALLRRITDRSDLTIATALTGRPYDELGGCAGHFTHWSPIHTGPESATTFSGLLNEIEHERSNAERAAELVPASYATRPTGWAAAYEAKEEAPVEQHADGVTFTLAWDDVEAEPCALKLESIAGDNSLSLVWRYREGEFPADYVRSLAGQYLTLLEGVIADPSTPLDTIGVLDSYSRDVVRATADHARATTRQTPLCLHQIIEDRAGRSPDAVAVTDPETRLTYRQLNEQAYQVALALGQYGIGPDQPVAIAIGHTRHLLVAMLGVLKAGGAYLPLDPELPRARTADMLTRSDCSSLILTDPDTPQDRFGPARCLNVDGLRATEDPVAPRPEVTPDNLAYVLFTSGSTGVPKGVMLPHRALANYVLWAARTYGHEEGTGPWCTRPWPST
jgi:hypothetical protein